jgi:hypothetical protein
VLLIHEFAFLDGQSFRFTPVAATVATAKFGLFLEPCHHPWIGPTRTIQIIIVLVSIFLQPAPHMTKGLMATENAASH